MAEAANGEDPSAQTEDGEQPVREARVEDGHLHAVVAGEITLHNSPAVRRRLLDVVREERPKTADLDLGGVPYMDSSAVAVLVEVLKAVRQAGGEGDHRGEHPVRLTNLNRRVRGLLQIARLDAIFELEGGEDEKDG